MRGDRLRVGDEIWAKLYSVGARPKPVRGRVLARDGNWVTLSTYTHGMFCSNLDIEEVIFAVGAVAGG
jgi:hypothetical protein